MYFRRDPSKWTARAPAKLNLYLEVLDRGSDGFHELETLMVPIRLSDSLSLERTSPAADGSAGDIRLEVREAWPNGPSAPRQSIPTGTTNLVFRALTLLRDRSGCQFGARVQLIKRVPAGAGLGGGSSDAAAALRLANRAWELNWSSKRLADLSAELGSDVPFFIEHGAAVCRGRGERVERLPPLPKLHFLIVKPPVELATAEVYAAFDRGYRAGDLSEIQRANDTVEALISGRRGLPSRWLRNGLQNAAASLTPWIDRLRLVFNQLDCLGHQLTGSGSAYFGVCRHAQQARRLATMLRTRQLGVVYATCSYP